MVNTRSQVRSSIPVSKSSMDSLDRNSDTESECSVPEVLSRDQIDELDDINLIRTDYNLEQRSIDQRFLDMNKQISDLTGLVLALTEWMNSPMLEKGTIRVQRQIRPVHVPTPNYWASSRFQNLQLSSFTSTRYVINSIFWASIRNNGISMVSKFLLVIGNSQKSNFKVKLTYRSLRLFTTTKLPIFLL